MTLPPAAFFFVFLVGEFIDTVATEGLQRVFQVGGLLGGVTIVLVLAGCVISWWRLLPAGSLLIFAYFYEAVSSGLVALYYGGRFQPRDFWSVLGLIYLVSGALFLCSWWLTRKAVPSAPPPSRQRMPLD